MVFRFYSIFIQIYFFRCSLKKSRNFSNWFWRLFYTSSRDGPKIHPLLLATPLFIIHKRFIFRSSRRAKESLDASVRNERQYNDWRTAAHTVCVCIKMRNTNRIRNYSDRWKEQNKKFMYIVYTKKGGETENMEVK